MHLAFTSGGNVYHTFLKDTIWSEPELIGKGMYPTINLGNDGKIYALYAHNEPYPHSLEELRLAVKNSSGWIIKNLPLAHTYNSFLWGIGAPSFSYFVFESSISPLILHPALGDPMPMVILIGATALIYGKFPLSHPENCEWQILDNVVFRPIHFDTITYKDSLLVHLLSPSITVDGEGVVHILWDAKGGLRYYRIIDTTVTKEIFADTGINFPYITMRGDQIDQFWCERDTIWYRYSWTKRTNLSKPQGIASCESPISSGQYLTWTKRENGTS